MSEKNRKAIRQANKEGKNPKYNQWAVLKDLVTKKLKK